MTAPSASPSHPEAGCSRARPGGRIARTWYVIGLGLITAAIALAGIGFTQMVSTVKNMQRVVMPGRVQIAIPAGLTMLYAESESNLDGKIIVTQPPFAFVCGVEDEQGKAMTITKSVSSVSYAISDYTGEKAFEVEVPVGGTYTLVCTSDQSFVMALGGGVGAWLVIGVLGLVPFLGGLVVILVVFLKRRRNRG